MCLQHFCPTTPIRDVHKLILPIKHEKKLGERVNKYDLSTKKQGEVGFVYPFMQLILHGLYEVSIPHWSGIASLATVACSQIFFSPLTACVEMEPLELLVVGGKN